MDLGAKPYTIVDTTSATQAEDIDRMFDELYQRWSLALPAGVLTVDLGGTGVVGPFTKGSVVFVGPSGVFAQDNANFFWDDTNNRLGLGIATPENLLELVGGGLRVEGEAASATAGKGIEVYLSSTDKGVVQTYNRATSTWLDTLIQGNSVGLIAFGTNQNITLTPSGTGTVVASTITAGGGATTQLTLQSTSGVGTTDKIVFLVGNNGGTLAGTITHDGNFVFGFDVQGATVTATGRISSASYIRAGAADSTSPSAGDLVANRGGTPGTGVVFFGGSANAHYLFYDATNFNFVGGGLVVTGTITATTFVGALTTTSAITTTSYIRAGIADSSAPGAGDIVANRGGNPGTGVIFFGGSANANYLYYDGSLFNFVGTGLKVTALTASGLTSGRVPIVSTGGLLVDDADLTFATDTLTVTKLSVSNITIFGAPARLKGYTVATLPAGVQGDTAFVTDALAPAFITALVGGGAVVTPAFYDGAAWVAY